MWLPWRVLVCFVQDLCSLLPQHAQPCSPALLLHCPCPGCTPNRKAAPLAVVSELTQTGNRVRGQVMCECLSFRALVPPKMSAQLVSPDHDPSESCPAALGLQVLHVVVCPGVFSDVSLQYQTQSGTQRGFAHTLSKEK